jgi:succinate dehydrogenase/fumarate reductase cytochrome b subunit
MYNQLFNLNNSKTGAKRRALISNLARAIPLVVGCLAVIILYASLDLPPALSGRLHPAAAPAAISLVTIAVALLLMFKPVRAQTSFESVPAAPGRAIVAAVTAILVLAVGVHTIGALAAVAIASAIAARGVSGVGLARATLIGAGVSGMSALVFVWALRQPLPLWPSLSLPF